MTVVGVAVALVVGAMVGLTGAGGAIIAVPALVYLVGLGPEDAVPTSLIVVGLSSLAGLLPRRHVGINWRLVAVLGAAGESPYGDIRGMLIRGLTVGLMVGFLTGLPGG